MLEINKEILIAEVEKRAPLYDKQVYTDINKTVLWNEVCKEVYTSTIWDRMSIADRLKHKKELLKKWTSLRHFYKRELTARRCSPSIKTTRKKKYIKYFDSLSFLLPFEENANEEVKVENIQDEQSNSIENSLADAAPNENSIEENNENNMLDEDELFLRSLTSHIKDLEPNQKLSLRIKIISTILNYKRSLNE